MPSTGTPSPDPRFEPRAHRALGEMFSEVSPRYDLLNSVLSLGQDRGWRYHLWATVPEEARLVADVCCGSGVSLAGLRRPGRTLLGFDASHSMLALAAERFGRRVGGPVLVRADGFRLPLADGTLDALTIAFGLRNLRPRAEALRELARVLRPGGTLAILEAAGPRPGGFAPVHGLYLKWVVPAVGLLSPEPRAYAYLARSILEFGDGRDLGEDCARAGLRLVHEQRFLLGATWLWVARREPADAAGVSVQPTAVQFARAAAPRPFRPAFRWTARQKEWQVGQALLAILNLTLVAALVAALGTYGNFLSRSHFRSWLTAAGWVVIWVGLAFSLGRAIFILSRLRYPPQDL